LLLIASIAFDPLAGFLAYVAAHAIEYIVVVYKTMQSRYGKTRDRSSILGRMVHTTWGRMVFLAAFLAVIYEVDQGLGTDLPNHAYLITVYSPSCTSGTTASSGSCASRSSQRPSTSSSPPAPEPRSAQNSTRIPRTRSPID
jgi:hypothetical protein